MNKVCCFSFSSWPGFHSSRLLAAGAGDKANSRPAWTSFFPSRRSLSPPTRDSRGRSLSGRFIDFLAPGGRVKAGDSRAASASDSRQDRERDGRNNELWPIGATRITPLLDSSPTLAAPKRTRRLESQATFRRRDEARAVFCDQPTFLLLTKRQTRDKIRPLAG